MRYEVRTVDGDLIRTTLERHEAEEWTDRRPGERYAVDRDLGRKYEHGEWS